MTDEVLKRFLETQFAEASDLAAVSDLLEIQPVAGDPPHRLIVRILARGLIREPSGAIVEADEFHVGVWLPEDYLLRADAYRVLTYLGPHAVPVHPNIRPPFVCVSIRPGTPLVDLIYACFEIWTWHSYAAGDALNMAAAQWARSQPSSRFPVDRRPLRRRRLPVRAEVTRPGAES